ncbi:MAG: prephenate dehydratase [Endomicrobiaceae bacterium]|nr:prephenate dehydratase [Endomicrobiaceae bacterium]MDD3923299.1 prephenate dehydratase [Endomicrobiaceae bacterium]
MNEKVLEYRNKIDAIDQKILKLLNERAESAIEIGNLKSIASRTVYVPSREVEVINNLVRNNKGPLEKEDILNIYKEIMSVCRSKEAKLKVSYLGPEATFSHQAALRQFGSKADFIPLPRFEDVVYEVEKGRADFAVVPIENSNEGAVSTTLDLLVDTKLNVINEINMRVAPCLLSNTKLENIKIVYSHQQPLAQCSNWLNKNLPNAEISSLSSTAEAAKMVSKNSNSAAIASEIAAKIYNLNILAKSIEDSRDNWTRFFVLGKNKALRIGNDKTTIIFSIKDRVSALYNILASFSKNKINLTKIESRPTKKKAWQYLFFVDFAGHMEDKKVKDALEKVENNCVFLKVLGSYPKAD